MRIILADHHLQPRLALKSLLEEELEFELIGEAVDSQELLTLAEELCANLILIDRELPGIHIVELIGKLQALIPQPVIIVMSSEFEYSRMLLKAGADAFISKGDASDWLLVTLRKYAKQIKMKEEANRKNNP